MAIFDIQILPKLVLRKIEWEIKSCFVDLNFIFWKFLEHSVRGELFSNMTHPTSHSFQDHFQICEVKAARHGLFSNLLPLRFYVKSNFGELKRSKNVIFANFRDSELWNLVNLELKNCSNLLKSQFRTSKIGKNGIFWAFHYIKIWFHVKSEWQ